MGWGLRITIEDALRIIEDIAETIEENKDLLTKLDSAIGDGDHGVNLSRGFQAARQKLCSTEYAEISAVLKTVGSTLVDSAGGAVGPLFGLAFIRASIVIEGKREVILDDLVRMFGAAEDGIISIGKAKVGEKTMLDAIHPAVESLKKAKKEKLSIISAFEQCVKAAENGMQNTIDMVAKRGRSMYLGNRTRGHQDVGATSCYLMLKSALETLKRLNTK